MRSKQQLVTVVKQQLAWRGLRSLHGKLALVHEDRSVHFSVDDDVDGGLVVVVLRDGQPVRQFCSEDGNYDWKAIAAAVVDVAQSYDTHGRSGARYSVVEPGHETDGQVGRTPPPVFAPCRGTSRSRKCEKCRA